MNFMAIGAGLFFSASIGIGLYGYLAIYVLSEMYRYEKLESEGF
ncbi:hypothetical protein NRY68_16535 [Acidithiobacillus ferrooxidans]|nr:hypothetical protein [Acidithiobacillus ferrooxidans]MCR1347358.1 hypothetical protein [Acidithiobacillus ferrooxidans]MCR1354781.1 hypothetical protein [Acidithiobacillus ferrooxidans]